MATLNNATLLGLTLAVAATVASAWTEVDKEERFVPTEGPGQSLQWTWVDRDGSNNFDSYINGLQIVQSGDVPYAAILNTICARAENTCTVVDGFLQGVSADQQRYMLPTDFAPAEPAPAVASARAVPTPEQVEAQRQAQREAFAAEVTRIAAAAATSKVGELLPEAAKGAVLTELAELSAAEEAAFKEQWLIGASIDLFGFDPTPILEWVRDHQIAIVALMLLTALVVFVEKLRYMIAFIFGRTLAQKLKKEKVARVKAQQQLKTDLDKLAAGQEALNQVQADQQSQITEQADGIAAAHAAAARANARVTTLHDAVAPATFHRDAVNPGVLADLQPGEGKPVSVFGTYQDPNGRPLTTIMVTAVEVEQAGRRKTRFLIEGLSRRLGTLDPMQPVAASNVADKIEAGLSGGRFYSTETFAAIAAE